MRLIEQQSGFTLVEILVTMLLSLIALAMLGQAFVSYKQSFDEQTEVIAMQNDVRIAMHFITEELLMAGYIPEGAGGEPSTDVSGEDFTDGNADNIEEMGTNSIAFLADIDDDNQTETIRYYWSGTPGDPLTREVWSWNRSSLAWGASGGAQEVIGNVESLTFTYDDIDKDDVRRITVALATRYLPGNDENRKRTSTLSTNLAPRNLDVSSTGL